MTYELSEKEWSAQVYDLARTLGWDRYHTWRSTKSPGGFPDETLWRDRVIFVELKTTKGRPSLSQERVLTGLARAGAEAYVWRPDDLEDVGRALSSRGRPQPGLGSLWLPEGCRADERI